MNFVESGSKIWALIRRRLVLSIGGGGRKNVRDRMAQRVQGEGTPHPRTRIINSSRVP